MDTGSDGWRARVPWSADEDEKLRGLVETHGAKNWPEIAAGIPGRSGRSCRLRWCNQLNPDLNHQPFTPKEDEVIVKLHAEHANKWTAIARFLPGRSDNAIMNHINSTLRRSNRRLIGASESDSVINRNCEIGEGVSSVTRVRGSEGPETALSLMPPVSLAEEEFGAPSNMIQRSGHHSNDNNLFRPLEKEEEEIFWRRLKKIVADGVRKCIDDLIKQGEAQKCMIQRSGHHSNDNNLWRPLEKEEDEIFWRRLQKMIADEFKKYMDELIKQGKAQK